MDRHDLRLHANDVENALLDHIEKLESIVKRQTSAISGLILDNGRQQSEIMQGTESYLDLDRRVDAIENNVSNVFDRMQTNTETTDERFEEIENTITEELG